MGAINRVPLLVDPYDGRPLDRLSQALRFGAATSDAVVVNPGAEMDGGTQASILVVMRGTTFTSGRVIFTKALSGEVAATDGWYCRLTGSSGSIRVGWARATTPLRSDFAGMTLNVWRVFGVGITQNTATIVCYAADWGAKQLRSITSAASNGGSGTFGTNTADVGVGNNPGGGANALQGEIAYVGVVPGIVLRHDQFQEWYELLAGWKSPDLALSMPLVQPLSGGYLPLDYSPRRNHATSKSGTSRVFGPGVHWAVYPSGRSSLRRPGGITVALGQATEQDVAQAMGKLKARALGLSTEQDLALATTRNKLLALGQATETDLAQAVARAKRAVLGLATEQDISQSMGRAKLRALGLATETDVAQAMGKLKARALGLSTEQDLALEVTALMGLVVGTATEVDVAPAMGKRKQLSIGLATEQDLAPPTQPRRIKAIGVATEQDLALAAAHLKGRALGVAVEADTGMVITWRKAKGIGLATEIDLALSISGTVLAVEYGIDTMLLLFLTEGTIVVKVVTEETLTTPVTVEDDMVLKMWEIQ